MSKAKESQSDTVKRLRRELKAARAVLRDVEWITHGGPVYECRSCMPGSWSFSKTHHKGCELAAVLARSGGGGEG